MALYEHILVAIDDSDIATRIIEHALTLAHSKVRISLMSVIALDPLLHADFYAVTPAIGEYFKAAAAQAEQRLQQLQTEMQAQGFVVDVHVVKDQLPAAGILALAEELQVDCILMGSHGRRGIEKWLLGSVAQQVLTQTLVPVMIVK